MLRIRASNIEALENNRYDALPGIPYGAGFVRSYADYLGLDPDPLVQQFRDEAAGIEDDKPQLYFPKPAVESRGPGLAAIGIGIAILVVAYLGWQGATYVVEQQPQIVEDVPDRLTGLIGEETPSPMPAEGQAPDDAPAGARSPTFERLAREPTAGDPSAVEDAPAGGATGPVSALPGEEPTAPGEVQRRAAPQRDQQLAENGTSARSAAASPASQPGASATLVVVAREPSWIEVTTTDGEIVRSGILDADERFAIPEDRPALTMITGNAGGIELILRGEASGPLGPDGEVLRNITLAPDTVEQRWFAR